MSRKFFVDADFGGVGRVVGLLDGVAPQDAATVAQLNAAIEGTAWKDSCRVATQANLNLAAPGASIDSISMATGDRVLVRSQTAPAENGIYVWNGAAVAATRAADASTAAELEQAVVTIEEGTSAGTTWRQTAVNFVLGTNQRDHRRPGRARDPGRDRCRHRRQFRGHRRQAGGVGGAGAALRRQSRRWQRDAVRSHA
jgi:hypothetical protein